MNETPSRILVVDDEPSITEFVGYALKKEGFQPDVVDNGEDALAMAQENDYDLFVLDIMLPGMDGYELCRRLPRRRHRSDAPRVRADGMPYEERRQGGFARGAAA